MLVHNEEGREIEIIDMAYGHDPVDSFILSAVYMDDGTDVDQDGLDYLNEAYAAEIEEKAFERMCGA